MMPPDSEACKLGHHHALPVEDGYISSSHFFPDLDTESRMCPWKLVAGPGQHIDITLIDFHHGEETLRKPYAYGYVKSSL